MNNFDFEVAHELIDTVESQCKQDLLLKNINIRSKLNLLFFKVYVKIFNTINIKTYAKFLKNEDPEIWLVNAVRS